MKRRTIRALSGGCLLAAVLVIVVGLPTEWYGLPQSGTYVFTPGLFEPLWMYRVFRPLAISVAFALVSGGIYALSPQDKTGQYTNLALLCGFIAVFGLFVVAVGGLNSDLVNRNWQVWLGVRIAIVAGQVGFLLVLCGFTVVGYRYFDTGRRRFGGFLLIGALLTALLSLASYWGLTGLSPVAVLFAVVITTISVELWRESTNSSSVAKSQ